MENEKEKLLGEKERLEGMLDNISMMDEHGHRRPIREEVGREQGEDAVETEQYANRLTLVKDLESALRSVEERIANL